MRKLPKGLLVKMVRIRLENEVILILIMPMIITRISMMLMRLIKMVRIKLENEVGYEEDNDGRNGEDGFDAGGGAIQHDDAGGTEKETGRKPILVCPIQ